jgi:hypothetical protein
MNPMYSQQLQTILNAGNQDPSYVAYNRQKELHKYIASLPKPKPTGDSTIAIPYNSGNSGSALEKLMRAISGQESGGNYNARNRSSGAMGKYQVMPSNLGGRRSGWDWEAMGRDVSPAEFMRNRSVQETIAAYKLSEYINKYGTRGAAAAWYGGPGAVKKQGSTKKYGKYPSIADYILQVMGRM